MERFTDKVTALIVMSIREKKGKNKKEENESVKQFLFQYVMEKYTGFCPFNISYQRSPALFSIVTL